MPRCKYRCRRSLACQLRFIEDSISRLSQIDLCQIFESTLCVQRTCTQPVVETRLGVLGTQSVSVRCRKNYFRFSSHPKVSCVETHTLTGKKVFSTVFPFFRPLLCCRRARCRFFSAGSYPVHPGGERGYEPDQHRHGASLGARQGEGWSR